MDEVCRILGCGSHYEVLKLVAPGTVTETIFVAAQQVRRRYKELAILVHPDKNRATDAEAAFKRLSEAYECLVDDTSQRSYLQKLQQSRVKSPKPTRPTHKHKYKRKRKASETPTEAEAKEPLPTKRRRTPEEIWQQFQREDEELARREFHAKGFERVYDSTPKRAAKTNRAGDNSTSSHTVSQTEQQDILDSHLDTKARKWAAWSKPNSTQAESQSTAATRGNSEVAGSVEETKVPEILICCLLCRRKFPTAEALGRHEASSKLHAANLQAQKARKSGDGP
ncbi:hypothetical protein PF010_g8052 [Phytophthora fragariae]|uniref:J domain-containing protein n=1 Tax=Phytophthora fragariae TaxID=53985 RepID=A0A6A3L535_9STRA|nr:hypothetical protein PF011_g8643 [Phytophthora fragariae]KAE9118928.1 hypothetical protein PF010_g8052 [Phytophthora fragariae]KAE9238775.1 hypothetical protein PF004_g8237 [Phytophthora fragariae]